MRGKGQKAGIGKLFFLLEKDRGRYLFFVFANAAFYSVGQLLQAFCTGRIVSVAQEGDLGGFFSAAERHGKSAEKRVRAHRERRGEEEEIVHM